MIEYLRRLSSRIRLLLTPGSTKALIEAKDQQSAMDMDSEDTAEAAVNSLSSFPLEFEVAGEFLLILLFIALVSYVYFVLNHQCVY
jgi:hypothetical protein